MKNFRTIVEFVAREYLLLDKSTVWSKTIKQMSDLQRASQSADWPHRFPLKTAIVASTDCITALRMCFRPDRGEGTMRLSDKSLFSASLFMLLESQLIEQLIS